MQGQSPRSSLRLQPRAVSLASVQDKPFVAQFVSWAIETDGTRSQAAGSLRRDREARTRCEYRISSGEQLAIISDPVSGELIFLDDTGRIAQVERSGRMSIGSGWAFQNCVPQWKDEHQFAVWRALPTSAPQGLSVQGRCGRNMDFRRVHGCVQRQ